MSETVTIRAARREDVPAILVIYNATVKEPAAAYEDSPNTLHQRARSGLIIINSAISQS